MTGTTKPDMVGHSCNPSMWETEAGGRPGISSKPVSQKNKTNKNNCCLYLFILPKYIEV